MQATHSARSASISSISNASISSASISSASILNHASRPPSIMGDVFAVVVWAAMVPCFMWLGNAMGL
jgi:hypothetical protein